MPAGRPTKYTPELIEKCYIYIDQWEEIGAKHKDKIPSHIALADYLGITSTCMYDWSNQEDKKEFSCILETINKLQQRILVNGGLSNDFNSNITKLVLGKHGFHERTEHSGPEGKPIPIVSVDMTADEAASIYNDIIS